MEGEGWTFEEATTIREHIYYYQKMADYLTSLYEHGRQYPGICPMKPASDVGSLYFERITQKRRGRTKKKGKELHEYLKQNLIAEDVTQDERMGIEPTSEKDLYNQHLTEEEILLLKTNYKKLQKTKSNSLKNSLYFGQMLNIAFFIYSKDCMDVSWTSILKRIGICNSYSRKLRQMYRLLRNYPKTFDIGLSFSEMYKYRREVEAMVLVEEFGDFWKEVPNSEMET